MKDEKLDFKPHPSEFSKYWSLDPEITFLNHGSFGACPIPVLEAQQRWRLQMESEPLRFFVREFEELLDRARSELAEFVGADAEELAFVPNATTGVNAVLRSLTFDPGDELLTTDHEYNACRNVLNFVAERTGAKVVVAEVPFPLDSPEEIIAAVCDRVPPKTKLALLDHITSQTGLILPIGEIIQELTRCGVDTLIDGAHAPGMIPLDLHNCGATYYTGNCHKWLCAPKGAAFLYVRQDKQSEIRPMTISHGANSPRSDKSRFQLEFDWMGTDDPTAYLCIPEAIKFMGSLLVGGWPELIARNRTMVLTARQMLCETLGVAPPCPDPMIGSMAVISLPNDKSEFVKTRLILPLQDALWEQFNIEVPINYWPKYPFRQMRISAQIYNTFAQYEYLTFALTKLLKL